MGSREPYIFGELNAREVGIASGTDEKQQDRRTLRRADMRRQYASQYVMVLKPNDDTKGGPGVVEEPQSHGHGKMDAVEFKSTNPWEVLQAIAETEKNIGKRVECIAIDEGQFVEGLFAFARYLLDAGHDVLVAGLDLDFRAIPLEKCST